MPWSWPRRLSPFSARTIVSYLMAATSVISAGPIYLRCNRSAGFTFPAWEMSGSALPTALAARLAYPDSRVIMLTGDGAFGFNAMEFDTAVRHKLNIVALLGNDSAWGIDRQIQLGLYGRAVATDLFQTRYDQVVQGLGGYGEFVERPEDLGPAIERALASPRPRSLNVVVQRAISPRPRPPLAGAKPKSNRRPNRSCCRAQPERSWTAARIPQMCS